MTTKDLIQAVADRSGETKAATKRIIDTFVETVKEELKTPGNKVQLRGFGNFVATVRASREGVNPRTRKRMTIPSALTVRFRQAKKAR